MKGVRYQQNLKKKNATDYVVVDKGRRRVVVRRAGGSGRGSEVFALVMVLTCGHGLIYLHGGPRS